MAGGLGQSISLPLWGSTFAAHSSGSPLFILLFASLFFVISFGIWVIVIRRDLTQFDLKFPLLPLALVGLCDALNGLLVVFASPPDRCPPLYQSILTSAAIPITIVLRFVLLRQKETRIQTLASIGVTAGLLVCLLPTMIGGSAAESDRHGGSSSGVGKVLWPLCFMAGVVPGALMNVVQERLLKTQRKDMRARQASFSEPVDTTKLAQAPAPASDMQSVLQQFGAGGTSPMELTQLIQPLLSEEQEHAAAAAMQIARGRGVNLDEEAVQRLLTLARAASCVLGRAPHPTTALSLTPVDPRQPLDGSGKPAYHSVPASPQDGSAVEGAAAAPAEASAHPKQRLNPIYMLFMTSCFQLLSLLLLSWIDILPSFGTSSNFAAMLTAIKTGAQCTVGMARGCGSDAFVRGMIFCLSYMVSYVSGVALLKTPSGATVSALISTLTVPLAALFWALFAHDPLAFDPTWSTNTTFAAAGLALLLPGVLVYNLAASSHKAPAAPARDAAEPPHLV